MNLKLTDAVAFQLEADELLVADSRSGALFFFSGASKDFFEFFAKPQSLDSFLERMRWDSPESDSSEYLKDFVSFLQKNELVETCENVAPPSAPPETFERPVFLRRANYKLNDSARMGMPSTWFSLSLACCL